MPNLIRVDTVLLFSRISMKTHLNSFRCLDAQWNSNADQFVFEKLKNILDQHVKCVYYQTCSESKLKEQIKERMNDGVVEVLKVLKVKHFIICLLKNWIVYKNLKFILLRLNKCFKWKESMYSPLEDI